MYPYKIGLPIKKKHINWVSSNSWSTPTDWSIYFDSSTRWNCQQEDLHHVRLPADLRSHRFKFWYGLFFVKKLNLVQFHSNDSVSIEKTFKRIHVYARPLQFYHSPYPCHLLTAMPGYTCGVSDAKHSKTFHKISESSKPFQNMQKIKHNQTNLNTYNSTCGKANKPLFQFLEL